jgi:hypothetical protein
MDQIKDVITQVIGELLEGKPTVQNKIYRVWEHVAEQKVRKHTAIAGFTQGSLAVHVDSPAWLFQMNFQKRKLLKKVQEEIPEVTAIIFKIGKVS